MHIIYQHALSQISRIIRRDILLEGEKLRRSLPTFALKVLDICKVIADQAHFLAKQNAGECTHISDRTITYRTDCNLTSALEINAAFNYEEEFKEDFHNSSGYFDYASIDWVHLRIKEKIHMFEQHIPDFNESVETLGIATALNDLIRQKKKVNKNRVFFLKKKYIHSNWKYHRMATRKNSLKFDDVKEILSDWDWIIRNGKATTIRTFFFKMRNTIIDIERKNRVLNGSVESSISRLLHDYEFNQLVIKLNWIFSSLKHVTLIDQDFFSKIDEILSQYELPLLEQIRINREKKGIDYLINLD